MRESEIEAYLVKRVKALGGEVRKVRWIGRNGAPDRVVMLPPFRLHADVAEGNPAAREWLDKTTAIVADSMGMAGRTIWVELKAPGVRPRPHQIREHERMARMGQVVVVVDSLEGVDGVLA